MGDFSQIILCYQLSKIDKDNVYLFITFDKIASYISALFNIGTLKEENDNPLLPLKFFTRKWVTDSSSTIQTSQSLTQSIFSRFIDFFSPTKTKQRLPLKIFNRNFTITDTNVSIFKDKINKFGKSKSSKQVVTYGIPKNELSKRRINSLISLAKKYKITLDNHTYKNLKRLHKLQVFAKSKRIPITYKNNNDVRKYKTLNRLEKEIKEYIKRTKH